MRRRNNLLKMASRAEGLVRLISKGMAIIAAIGLGTMMLLTVADVSGRYFFNHPIDGAWEMIGLLLVCAGTWGLAYCQMEKGHINVTVILDRFPLRVQAIVHCVAYLVGLVGFSLICWRTLLLTKRYIAEKGHITDTLHIPYYPFTLMMAIGAGMLALILLVDLVRSVREVALR